MVYEPPKYPAAIPTTGDLPDRTDDIDWLYAARYNELKKELRAAMIELGILPKGTSADIAERLKGVRSLADALVDVIIIKVGNVGIGKAIPSTKLDVDGIGTFVAVNAVKYSNTLGDLKIQPDVQGNVIVFGDTKVGDEEAGKKIIITRYANEGIKYFSIYFDAYQVARFDSTGAMKFRCTDGSAYFQAADAIYFTLGDNAGTFKTYIRDSDNAVVASIDSDGNAYFVGNVGIGTDDPKSKLDVVGLPVYADNAAALVGGLQIGSFYRTGADPDPVCVVH